VKTIPSHITRKDTVGELMSGHILSNMLNRMMIMAIAGINIISCNSPSSGDKETIPQIFFNASEVNIKTQQGISYINKKPAHGYLFLLQKKDTVLLEGYINGKKNGRCFSKYSNLRYQSIQYFINGKAEGLHQSWWENGKIKQLAEYNKDVFDGSLKEWNQDGMITRDNHYINGHEAGKQRLWYDNGKLRANYVIKDGRMYGLSGTMNCFNATEKNKL
jgi:antitoxin component YwqK of YwqJK toxin-antitoxin module